MSGAVTKYSKPYLTIEQQLELLQLRGLLISDQRLASSYLDRLGYYRLSGYWYPMRIRAQNGDVSDQFQRGSEFGQAVNLYVFDKKLRLILLDAIERIEVALRVHVALTVGQHSPWAHREAQYLDGTFAKKRDSVTGKTLHEAWLEDLDKYTNRSREDFVKNFKSKYPNSHLPIWMAIEVWDFGMLARFIEGMQYKDRLVISKRFDLLDPRVLTSWTRSINFIRNVCAHHQRLWNRTTVYAPRMPKLSDVPLLDHLIGNHDSLTKTYAVAALLRHMLLKVNPSSRWHLRLKEHIASLPSAPGVNEGQIGCPIDWQSLPLWIDQTSTTSLEQAEEIIDGDDISVISN